MSLIDPAVERYDAIAKHRGSPKMRTVTVAGLLLISLSGLALGFAFGLLAGELRHSVIDSVFDDRDTMIESRLFVMPALMTTGIFGLIAGLAGYYWAGRRYLGGEHPWPLPAPVGVVAVTLGFSAATLTWLAPLKVGTQVDPTFGHDQAWGWGSWIAYRMDLWIPLLLALASFTVIRWAVQTVRARVLARRERDRLLVEGVRVPGDLVDVRVQVSSDGDGSSRVIGATVTVRYLDHAHQQRWVERFTPDAALQVGPGGAVVLYDRDQPGADQLIFVAFRREPLPSDWIGARVG